MRSPAVFMTEEQLRNFLSPASLFAFYRRLILLRDTFIGNGMDGRLIGPRIITRDPGTTRGGLKKREGWGEGRDIVDT